VSAQQAVGGDIRIFITLITMHTYRRRFNTQLGILRHAPGRRQWISLFQQLGLHPGQRADRELYATDASSLLLPGHLLNLFNQCLTDSQFVHGVPLSPGQHLIIKFPCSARFLGGDFLDGVTDVDYHVIANLERFVL
jgi:hypothetical protein